MNTAREFQTAITGGSDSSGGGFASAEIFSPTNPAPVANAGPDQTVNEGAPVALDGSQSAEGQDGFLTMSEVLNLALDADLTTLSACQTGLGEQLSGEGVMGLARAFQYAGSRSVLVSLWNVDDEATAALMGAFYRHLSRGVPMAGALARAKLDVQSKEAWSHPFFWGAFVLFSAE
jgi:CHAT domain-containing protein